MKSEKKREKTILFADTSGVDSVGADESASQVNNAFRTYTPSMYRDTLDGGYGETREPRDRVPVHKDHWKPEHDIILCEWADKAMCYRWLHFRSYQMYNAYNRWYTIPVIIISTLTGTANFATASFGTPLSSVVIGSFNIVAGIISTIQHFLKISELNESHKLSSLLWDKFYRNIKIELSKNPDDRISSYNMLKIYKDEYNRLMETSPMIENCIVQEFKREFEHTEYYSKVIKPEICDHLIPTVNIVYRRDKNMFQNMDTASAALLSQTPQINNLNMCDTVTVDVDGSADYKPPPLGTNHTTRVDSELTCLDNVPSSAQPDDAVRQTVDSFIREYNKTHNVKPSPHEIIRNLKDRIDQDTLRELVRV